MMKSILIQKSPGHSDVIFFISIKFGSVVNFQVKFDVDYDEVLPTEDDQNEFEQMILTEYSNVWPDVRMKSGQIGRGRILTLVIIGPVKQKTFSLKL